MTIFHCQQCLILGWVGGDLACWYPWFNHYGNFIAANKRIKINRSAHHHLFRAQLTIWIAVPMDICETKEDVPGLLVNISSFYDGYDINMLISIFHFSCSFHLIHFLICLFFEGEFPSLSYWLLNVTCLVIMTVTSEYLCLKEEMKEIPLYQALSTKADLWNVD